jgi:hypothetical protein
MLPSLPLPRLLLLNFFSLRDFFLPCFCGVGSPSLSDSDLEELETDSDSAEEDVDEERSESEGDELASESDAESD